MNICITGALGHIGSYLIHNWKIGKVNKVYLVDNLTSLRYPTLFSLPKNPKYIFKHMDIKSPDLERIIADSQIVIHLAAISDQEYSYKHPRLVRQVNVLGTKHIIELCQKHNTRLLFPSTTSIYSQNGVVDENNPLNDQKPESPYAKSKLIIEKYLTRNRSANKLKYVILRFGTVYGYSIGMRFNTAVNKFIFQAAFGQKITIWKTAFNQIRPYCDIVDAGDAIFYVINNKLFDFQTYNIVSSNLTVKEIVEKIKKYIPKTKVDYINSLAMTNLTYTVLNKKSIKAGFSYKADFDITFKKTIRKLTNISL